MNRIWYRVFGWPVGLLVAGCIPGVSWFLYSGHGGVGWFVLPLCFPYIVALLAIHIWRLPSGQRASGAKTAGGAVLLYMIFSAPTTLWTEHYLASSIGLQLPAGSLFKLANFPLGYVFPPYAGKTVSDFFGVPELLSQGGLGGF